MVHLSSVRENLERGEVTRGAEAGRIQPVHADLLGGRYRVGECKLLELWVNPCFCHQSGGRSGSDLLGVFGKDAVLFGGEKALLDAQFAQRDLQDLEVRDLVNHRFDGLDVVAVDAVVVSVIRPVMIRAWAGGFPFGI